MDLPSFTFLLGCLLKPEAQYKEPQGFRRPVRELWKGRRGPFCAPTYPCQNELKFSKELQSFQMSDLF